MSLFICADEGETDNEESDRGSENSNGSTDVSVNGADEETDNDSDEVGIARPPRRNSVNHQSSKRPRNSNSKRTGKKIKLDTTAHSHATRQSTRGSAVNGNGRPSRLRKAPAMGTYNENSDFDEFDSDSSDISHNIRRKVKAGRYRR